MTPAVAKDFEGAFKEGVDWEAQKLTRRQVARLVKPYGTSRILRGATQSWLQITLSVVAAITCDSNCLVWVKAARFQPLSTSTNSDDL